MPKNTTAQQTPRAFDAPVYVTRPMLAELSEYIPHFQEIWDSKILTNGGSKHRALEDALAQMLEVPHVKLFNNGTIALLVAFKALGLTGEVITTPFTFPATVHSLSWNGITPVFCDIEPETMCIDPAKIEPLITEKTSAIMGVHVYGNPCAVDKIQKLADKYRLKVVYDAAHAFRTTVWGKSIAGYGDMSMFSFHATKLFHTLEGGALAFTDPVYGDTIDMLKNFGLRNEMEVPLVGINGKMNEVQASVGLVNLKLMEGERSRRAVIKTAYANGLRGVKGISISEVPSHVGDSMQYVVMRVGRECAISRDDLHEALKTYNVFSRRYFYPLCSDYECYSHLPPSQLPVAKEVSEEVLCLPLYGALTAEDVERIIGIIRFHAEPGAVTVSTKAPASSQVA